MTDAPLIIGALVYLASVAVLCILSFVAEW